MDPLDKDVEDFFNSGGEVPENLQPEITLPTPEPPVQAAAVPPAAAQSIPVEDPALLALRAQLGQLQGYSAQLERSIQDMQKAPPAQVSTPPDPETDPLGHMMHELAETKKMLAQLTGRMAEQDQVSAQTQQLQGFVGSVQNMTTAFMAKQPDYANAYAHLRSVRTQDMRELGVPENQINDMLLKEELAVASSAIRQGMNPAQMVYNIAKRYGYQAPATLPATAKMDALKKGAAAAPTQVDKSGTHVDLTIDSVKDMTADQLDKLVESNDLWHKVVGGSSGGNSIFH